MDDLRNINNDRAAEAGQTPAPASRDLGLDIAKGIAIACVVIGHVIRGFRTAGLLEYNLSMQALDNFLYGFHVQLFFIISIYIAFHSASSLRFQINRNTFLYYSYLIWSLISWAAGYMAGSSVNHRPEVSELYTIPFVPYAHFWFLLVLIITLSIVGVLRRPWQLVAGMVVCVIFLAANLLGWCQLNYFLLFGLAGGAWKALRVSLPNGWATTAFGIASLTATAVYAALVGANIQTLMFIPASLLGCVGVLAGSSLLATQPKWSRFLAAVGRASLPIYLLHVFAASGIRIILYQLVPDLPAALGICAAIAGGIFLPIVAQNLARRIGLSKLMGLDTFSIFGTAAKKSVMFAGPR